MSSNKNIDLNNLQNLVGIITRRDIIAMKSETT